MLLRILSSVFFLLILIISQGCGNQESNIQKPESYPVTTVLKIDTSTFQDYVAEIHSIQNVEIRAKVSGYLEGIFMDEGKFVQKGQLLFQINPTEYKNGYDIANAHKKSALADLRSAELELKNVQQLHAKNVISITELEIAKNKLEAAKAKVEEAIANQNRAENNLAFTSLKAPFNGITNKIPFKTGSLINEGALLTTISDNSEVFAYFDVSEKEYLTYANNVLKDSAGSKNVGLVLANGQEHPYPGKIETIEGEIDPETGNIAFRARFKNPDRILKHGSSGKVRLKKKYPGALIVPQKATFEVQDKVYVYALTKENKVETRNIFISQRMPHLFIVRQGLNEGDRIIYEGIQNVRDEMLVDPTLIPMEQILKELVVK